MGISLARMEETSSPDLLSQPAWYAVYTKSRHEQVAHNQLRAKGLEVFLPTVKTWSRRTDRRLRIELPMFPGYLFVRTTLHPEKHLSVLRTVGVVKLISFKGRPMPVKPEEIKSLKILIETGVAIHPTENFHLGDWVRIVEGPFKGVVGRLISRRSAQRLVVAVETINRAVYVEVEDHLVRKVEAL
ncbi:MAG: UpxY family transcription antiterminator [Deltaproteobacteria bacterium]|nr:UpxY family transcription antiterminator [Deltaproteobacteria bacterium]